MQMGSSMKKSIFDEQTSKALMKWRNAVKKRQGGKGSRSPTVTLGGSSSTVSKVASSGRTLHRHKTTGHSTRGASFEDNDNSDVEADTLSPASATTNLIVRVDHHDEEETEANLPHISDQETSGGDEDDFSFNPSQHK